MGRPMATNLLKAGYALTVYNRTRATAEALGVAIADSPAALARGADVVITMVADDASQEAVLFGPDGVAAGTRPGQTVINMGTISPILSRSVAERLDARGVAVLDAPVSGSVKPATDGTLVILVGGDAAAVAACRPIFDVLGKRTFHFGGHGQGATAKLAINMVLGTMLQALAEAVVFGEATGLDRDILLDMIAETPCAAPILTLKSQSLRRRDYPAVFPLKHMAKDVRLALAAAGGVEIPAARTVSASFDAAERQGLGEQDVMAIIKLLEGTAADRG
ncbi:MAG: NAD(P)-dependent oxidoreductase [Magnetospirillum sp.]|nr:NAD(P)-dependent oxidoreductase [Magnetospirillum sp.]